jgi:hypothetical protein
MSRGALAQVLKLGLLTSFVILAVSGCGGVSGGGQAQQHQTETHAIPKMGKPLSPGRYATKTFNAAMSFSVGEGWVSAQPEMPDQVWIQTGPTRQHQILFTNPLFVFKPGNPSEELPAPENAEEWVSWFQGHPNLDTSKPAPVSVGDASGKRIDVTLSSAPENYSENPCGKLTCVPLYPISAGGVASVDGWKDRFVIVDVGEEAVLIDVAAPVDEFEAYLPKAQKVLDSVEWKGG